MQHPLLLYFLSIITILFNQSVVVQSECNICNAATSTACISQTEFQQCENNEPFGNVYSCNKGYYCSVLGNCTAVEELSDCKDCKKCDPNKIFACTGTQIFALCLGENIPSQISGLCTGNLTCNINNPNICGNGTSTCSYRDDPIITTTTESTTTSTTTTTTPSPAQDPNGFCQHYQKEGRYPAGTNPQTTCRQYISCIKVGTTWYGPIYNCPGETYFDSSKNHCTVEKPSTCAGTVGRLFFQHIPLD